MDTEINNQRVIILSLRKEIQRWNHLIDNTPEDFLRKSFIRNRELCQWELDEIRCLIVELEFKSRCNLSKQEQ
jgi:hypothetical protein